MAEDTPETTQPTEPAEAPTTDQNAPAEEGKPKPCIMCDLKQSGPGFIASCAKPKLEAYGDDVGQAQEGLKKLIADKGVDAELTWKWA